MFIGKSLYNLDNKGRVSIPPRYRETLHEQQNRTVVLTNFDTYIMVFPKSEWVQLSAEMSKQSPFDKEARDFLRFLNSGAEECALDRMGRILIPPDLREYAKMTREVYVVGAGPTFEIWDRQAYETRQQDSEASLKEEVYKRLGART